MNNEYEMRCFWPPKHKRPSLDFKERIEQFKKDNPMDLINKPYQSDYFKATELVNKLLNGKD